MSDKRRFSDLLGEVENMVTEDQFGRKLLGHTLKRISDEEYDAQCVKRFRHLSPKEIELILKQEIIDGKENT